MSIIIIGAGVVGTTLALAVSKLTYNRLPIHLVEQRALNALHSCNSRTIALSKGTCQQLARINIWPALVNCATEITKIHVSDCGHSGFFSFDAEDYQINALGQVVKLEDMENRLYCLLEKTSNVTLHRPALVSNITRTKKAVFVTLNDGTQLQGNLLVAADGTRSSIGTICGIKWYQKSYNQAAVVANVSTSVFHYGSAFERFTKNGPLAMLPISHGRSSLVWCHPIEKLEETLSWSDTRFCNELQKIFGWRLGRILDVDKRSAYPLSLTIASRFILHRAVLVGNAAQTLHPIAGQGFNLGLRDVMDLAEILAESWTNQKEYGDWSSLWKYQKNRIGDKKNTIRITDSLVHLFSSHRIPLVIVRNLGLIATQLFAPIRNLLARHSLGLNT